MASSGKMQNTLLGLKHPEIKIARLTGRGECVHALFLFSLRSFHIVAAGTVTNSHGIQEAQLLQRDRAPLLVVKYFAKSLKITQGHSKRHC